MARPTIQVSELAAWKPKDNHFSFYNLDPTQPYQSIMWVLIAAITVLLVAFILSMASMRRKQPLVWHVDDRTCTLGTSATPPPTPIVCPQYYCKCSEIGRQLVHKNAIVDNQASSKRSNLFNIDPQRRLANVLHSSLQQQSSSSSEAAARNLSNLNEMPLVVEKMPQNQRAEQIAAANDKFHNISFSSDQPRSPFDWQIDTEDSDGITCTALWWSSLILFFSCGLILIWNVSWSRSSLFFFFRVS